MKKLFLALAVMLLLSGCSSDLLTGFPEGEEEKILGSVYFETSEGSECEFFSISLPEGEMIRCVKCRSTLSCH